MKRNLVCNQAKRRSTRVANNLEKSINDSVILNTLESRYNEFKDSWTEVQRKHDKYMEHVTEQSNEEWINSLKTTYCEIKEKADAFTEKKIKKSKSERKIEDEQKYTEELKIHREQEGIKLMQHIDEIEKLIFKTTEKSDLCKALKKGDKQLAGQIAACESIHPICYSY